MNLSTAQLVERLARNRGHASPPESACLRTALVRHNTETTYVVPGDWPRGDNDWFLDGRAPAAGSDVHYFVDGPKTFAAMAEAMETADRPGHFIVLVGWSLQHDFVIYNNKTFLQIVEERASRGVPVRVLLWDNTEMAHRNPKAYDALNDLRKNKGLDVHCILDDHTAAALEDLRGLDLRDIPALLYDSNSNARIPLKWGTAEDYLPADAKRFNRRGNLTAYGCHHHKILLVFGREGLIGFCGGVDLDDNRLRYLHDVHLRATGEAAKKLLKIAEERWAHSKDNGQPPIPSTISVLSPPNIPSGTEAPYLARVVQTVGNPDLKKTVPNTLWRAVRRGIEMASRFIYIEDQYFWSLDLVRELVRAAKRLRHITILLPHEAVGEGNSLYLRQRAIQKLLSDWGSDPGIERKIGIYAMKRGDHEWVHSKLFVFDDEYAIVGTANANNRGYFLDSEAAVGVTDRAWDAREGRRRGDWSIVEANFARRLRIELWKEHLGLVPDEVFDGVGARAHWELLPPSAQVTVYAAMNLPKYLPLWSAYQAELKEWNKEWNAAQVNGLPFTKPPPEEPVLERRDGRPWWEGYEEGWEAEESLGASMVDPKQ